MSKFIRRLKQFQRKHIHPYDPAGLSLKRSLKTMAAVAAAMAVTYHWEMPTWGAVAAYFLSQIPPGVPLPTRRKVVLLLVVSSSLAVIPATVLGHGVLAPTIAVALAAFAAFLASALGPHYGACTLWVLLLTVVALGRPADWDEGLLRGLAVATGGMLTWLSHYVVFPLRPARLIPSALSLVVDDLRHLMKLVISSYPTGEQNREDIQQAKEQVTNSLDRIRRLPRFLELSVAHRDRAQESLLSLNIDLVRVYENLLFLTELGQFGGDSKLLEEFLPKLKNYAGRTLELLDLLEQGRGQDRIRSGGKDLLHEIEQEMENLRGRRREQYEQYQPRDWLVLSNSLYAVYSMARDLVKADGQRRVMKKLYPLPGEPAAPAGPVWQRIRQSLAKDKTPLRTAVQAAVASGLAMFLVKLFQIHFGYWVVIFALLAVKPDLGSTIAMGKQRIIGTVLGAALAVGFVLLVGTEGPVYTCGVITGAFLTLYLMNFPNQRIKAITTTFTLVSLIAGFSDLGWEAGVLRVVETTIAVAIGLGAALFLWPNQASRRLRDELAKAMAQSSQFFDKVFQGFMKGDMVPDSLSGVRMDLKLMLDTVDGTLRAAGQEPGHDTLQAAQFQHLLLHQRHVYDLLLTMDAAASQSRAQGYQNQVISHINGYATALEQAMDRLSLGLRQAGEVAGMKGLEASHQALRQRLAQLRQEGLSHASPLQDLLNLSSFIWGMRSIQKDLEQEVPHVNDLARN